MGLFTKSKKQKTGIENNWKTLENIAQLAQIKENSKTKPILIFKHSTRCGISSMAKNRLERSWDIPESEMDFYYLDLIAHRNISNQIAEDFEVIHQSPQVLLIQNEKAIFDASHSAISTDLIKRNLEKTKI